MLNDRDKASEQEAFAGKALSRTFSHKTPPKHEEQSIPITDGRERHEEQVEAQQVDEGRRQPRSPAAVVSEKDLGQIWLWNATVPQRLERCIHDLISEQSHQRGQDVAVASWDGHLTYARLDELSNLLAHHLATVGVRAQDTVPLFFEKSVWAVVAVLGVLKAGAAFSPTDPSQPEARLRAIVAQTGSSTLVASTQQSDLAARVGADTAAAAVVVSVSQTLFDTMAALPPLSLPPVSPSSLMYVIFTSGSTGRPKGVAVSHASYASGAVPRAQAVGYGSGSRVFDFASYAFDVSIDCMLLTLACGGRLCVPSEQDRVNNLSGAIRDCGANMLHTTPSVARLLDAGIISSLDVLGLGGEAVSASDAAAWSRLTRLVIAYGPSECTVACTINSETLASSTGTGTGTGAIIGIGKGVGCNTWLTDSENHERLVPIGDTGELLIEGPVVASGYIGEPEKTAEVFIQDPSWLTAGHASFPGRRGRLYKTGDLVRYRPDGSGSLEFVGRKDQQVKIRGQRVELAEVEHHLQSCLPRGTKVAAQVIERDNTSSILVAFICESASGPTASPSEQAPRRADNRLFAAPRAQISATLRGVQSAMAKRVPRYMIPAAFVTLESIPLLVSGKTDRKQLEQIGAAMPHSELFFVAKTEAAEQKEAQTHKEQPNEEPVTEVEQRLASAWLAVLGSTEVSRIYRDGNFFSLGGDSLRAMKLVAVARDYGLTLTVADIMSSQSLAVMAGKASLSRSQPSPEDIVPFFLLPPLWDKDKARKEAAILCRLEPDLVHDVYPCTPLQEALMALSIKEQEAYVAQRVAVLKNADTAKNLMAAFSKVSHDCPILRTRIVQVPGRGLLQVVIKEELECCYGHNLESYLLSDRAISMKLGGALVRYAVISNDDGTGRAAFVLTIHHALYDGWAMPLIIERVNKAYRGQLVSRPAEFKHFIRHLLQQDRASSEKYWKSQLKDAHPLQFPQLPYKGYQVRADQLLEEYVSLQGLLTRNAAVTATATVATVIRGAWSIVAAQYINSPDVIFGETLTGRNAAVLGAEEIEGPMITTLPFRVQVNREAHIAVFLQSIQEQIVAQIPHEQYGLQHIRRLSPDARQACEMRTGLVLHPSAGAEAAPLRDESLMPASCLVPASDFDAAREALKCNPYALMLVCFIDPNGFLVKASFDSNVISKSTMQSLLRQLGHVARELTQNTTSTVGSIQCLDDEDVKILSSIVTRATHDAVLKRFNDAKAAYIVRSDEPNKMIPFGAVGELMIQTSASTRLDTLTYPSWLEKMNFSSSLDSVRTDAFRLTGISAMYDQNGNIQIIADNKDTSKEGSNPLVKQAPRELAFTSQRQRKLRSIWSRVLAYPENDITSDDDFFLLGGDSITAMKLASEARLEGICLSVAQIFDSRTLREMTIIMDYAGPTGDMSLVPTIEPAAGAFELLNGIRDTETFVSAVVRPQLEDQTSWKVANVLPTRFLQQIAVRGTTDKPRFSVRYELISFHSPVNLFRLRQSCQDLVAFNEILRTVFVESAGQGYAVVLESLPTPFEWHLQDDATQDLSAYTKDICRADANKSMPLGSSFAKWLFVSKAGTTAPPSCLALRISHAQYDEMCLPILLRQLSALYVGKKPQSSVPFSSYVSRIMRHVIPSSVPYWTKLLAGSTPTVLRPATVVARRAHFSIQQSVNISSRARHTTVASLPTAAWALCLAKRTGLRDVTFGEVVSGRAIDLADGAADAVIGPCWQYVPVRVRLQEAWTGSDLLEHVQRQHLESAAHEGISLSEIAELCGTGWEKQKSMTGDEQDRWWFDTVVHQDVSHVSTGAGAGASYQVDGNGIEDESETEANRSSVWTYETLYVHQEPLREWKIQAFVREGGESMTLEIVTFESWAEYAKGMITDLVSTMESLVQRPNEDIF